MGAGLSMGTGNMQKRQARIKHAAEFRLAIEQHCPSPGGANAKASRAPRRSLFLRG